MHEESGCFVYVILGTMQRQPGADLVPGGAFETKDSSGIADERGIYFPETGLLGFTARPSVHVIDLYALSDPFLARLPAMNTYFGMQRWRIGHFCREVPPGYPETLDSSNNLIADKSFAE